MYWYTNKWEEGTKIQTNFGGAVYKLEEGNLKLIMYIQTLRLASWLLCFGFGWIEATIISQKI